MTPEQRLATFIARFTPENQRLIRALRRTLRRRHPAANELVWDNYNFLVIAYGPNDRASDAYFSVGADKNGATLFFGYNGKKIADPQKLLQGSGAANRFVRLRDAGDLDRPEIVALLASAIAVSKPMSEGKGTLEIRSESPKQRPRR